MSTLCHGSNKKRIQKKKNKLLSQISKSFPLQILSFFFSAKERDFNGSGHTIVVGIDNFGKQRLMEVLAVPF